jgi:hypothetical protein
VGNPIDVYATFARSALVCWFGANGPLRETHIFHADVPTSTGGAEIVIHERDVTQANPRGARAFQVVMAKESDQATRVTIEQRKLPADLGEALRRDVLNWVRGGSGCEAQVARPPTPMPVAAAPKTKTLVRAKR